MLIRTSIHTFKLIYRRPYGIDTINSTELRRSAGLLCGINSKFKSNESPFQSDNFQNMVQRLNQIHSAYTRMKITLREDPNRPNTSLSIASDNFPAILKEIYDPSARLKKEVERETEKGNILKDEEGKTIGSRRKQLRQKFYFQEGMSYRENVSNYCTRSFLRPFFISVLFSQKSRMMELCNVSL